MSHNIPSSVSFIRWIVSIRWRHFLAAFGILILLASNRAFASNHVVILAGKGGTSEYSEKFGKYASAMKDLLVNKYGYGNQQVTVFAESGSAPEMSALPCRAEVLEKTFADLSQTMRADDVVIVVIFGHGSHDGLWGKLNLEGPDVRDLDFARMLDALPAKRQIFVNTTSASASFIEKLTRADRVVISATRSPSENYATIFPEFFVESFSKAEEADLNKDQRISFLEAFDYARDRVVRFYEEAGRLRPEHAMLDDNGDGIGSEIPSVAGPANDKADGATAAQLFFDTGSGAASGPAAASSSPMDQRKAKLLKDIEALKARKSSMSAQEYERKMEELFIQLARHNRKIKAGKQ